MALCRAPALAETEFCPARIDQIDATPFGVAAKTYSYQLQARAARTVEGTIIADTDAGWFTWTQQPVQLTRTTYTRSSPQLTVSFRAAESPDMTVDFPKPVIVRHAWVEAAQAHGDEFFGWDARGMVTCEPPDFGPPKYPNDTTTRRTPQPGDATPAPAPPPINAVAATAPFSTTCAQPFVSARIVNPVQPDFPRIVVSQGFANRAVSEIAVAINPQGQVVDAWVFAKSGYSAIDAEALKAARQSKYSGGVSYCQPISDTYLFRADFER